MRRVHSNLRGRAIRGQGVELLLCVHVREVLLPARRTMRVQWYGTEATVITESRNVVLVLPTRQLLEPKMNNARCKLCCMQTI